MPIYEYECEHCRYYVELMQKISDTPLKKCPSCGRNSMKKLISAPAFRLKGSGWYETDFKSEQERKRNLVSSEEAESKPSADASSGAKAESVSANGKTATEAKADSKAEPKAEPKAQAKPERKMAVPVRSGSGGHGRSPSTTPRAGATRTAASTGSRSSGSGRSSGARSAARRASVAKRGKKKRGGR